MSKRKSVEAATGDELDEDKRLRFAPPDLVEAPALSVAAFAVAPSLVELEGAAALSRVDVEPALSFPCAVGGGGVSPRRTNLYDDVLGVVFSFLKFVELTRACVCRAWRHAAVTKPKCRRLKKTDFRAVSLPVRNFPLVQRHIRMLDWSDEDHEDGDWPSVSEMQTVCRSLPRLTTIKGTLNPRCLHPDIPDLFSRMLRRLDLRIEFGHGDPWCWPSAVLVMDTVCSVPTLTHLQLTFACDDTETDTRVTESDIRFVRPLQNCLELKHFGIEWENCDEVDPEWTHECLDVFRSLPKLTELDIVVDELDYFLADPTKLKLVSLYRQNYSRGRVYHFPYIAQLSSLTSIKTEHFDVEDPSFLRRLPHLHIVDLSCTASCPLEPLFATLAVCAHVHTLMVCHPALTSYRLCTWLRKPTNKPSPLPALKNLTIYVGGGVRLSSLRVLSEVKRFSWRLRSLCVRVVGYESAIPVSELEHIFKLRGLVSLTLERGTFSTMVDAETRASMTPGSATFNAQRFPKLTCMHWG